MPFPDYDDEIEAAARWAEDKDPQSPATAGETLTEKIEGCFDDLVISNSGNYIEVTIGDKSVNVDYEHFMALRKRLEAVVKAELTSLLAKKENYGRADTLKWAVPVSVIQEAITAIEEKQL